VSLQQKLVRTFEATVRIDIESIDLTHAPEIYGYLKESVQHGCTISEIVGRWPEHLFFYDILFWVKPTEGFVELEGENWIYQQHGRSEIAFKRLPSGLDVENVEALKKGNEDAWQRLPLRDLLTVDVTYLEGGRTDGVRAWSVCLFVESVGSRLGSITLDKHRELLKRLVKEGILLPAPVLEPKGAPSPIYDLRPGRDDRYFVFATKSEKGGDV
jgi:hypothetical protein